MRGPRQRDLRFATAGMDLPQYHLPELRGRQDILNNFYYLTQSAWGQASEKA